MAVKNEKDCICRKAKKCKYRNECGHSKLHEWDYYEWPPCDKEPPCIPMKFDKKGRGIWATEAN